MKINSKNSSSYVKRWGTNSQSETQNDNKKKEIKTNWKKDTVKLGGNSKERMKPLKK